MPAFVVKFLIKMALKLGVPFLLSKIPFLTDETRKIIQDFLEQLASHAEDKQEIVDSFHVAIGRELNK
jgi:hypothetical protein